MQAIIPISNRDPRDPGVAELRQTVIDVASKQSYWGERRPIKWLLLADKLDQTRDVRQEEPTMSVTELLTTASQLGLQREELGAFLKFHHNLGDLVYFDEPGLNDIVILSPQWLGKVFRY